MIKNIQQKIERIRNLSGHTPLLEISLEFRGEERRIYAKAEHYNLTGSIKDRMALHVLEKAYREGRIKAGDTIVEATSGNTGISFAAIACYLGNPVTILMPDWMSAERINLMRSFGANIQLVSAEEGGFLGCIRLTEELAKNSPGVFLPAQFANQDNSEAHYLTTGPEIHEQLAKAGLTADALVAGVGTGGTVMGIGQYLRAKNPAVKLYPMESASSPTMSTGYKVGRHRIAGISDEFIPPIVDLAFLDEVIQVEDGDAIIMAQRLAAELGLGVGISSGANMIAALMAQEKLGKEAVVVTVFPDDNKKYLSTDLMKKEPVKPGYLSTDVCLKDLGCL